MAEPQPVWDVHHHWVNEEGYIDRLLRAMDRLGVERVGLIAMGDLMADLFLTRPQAGQAGNAELGKLLKSHGDRFWGWGFIRLGKHDANDVDRLVEMGMSGLKFHLPMRAYSDLDYFSVYEKAQRYKLPCLFHTGIVYPPAPLPDEGIWSENYRPIHVERIAQACPDLKIICAHLGVCWNDEAATLCRICPNIYADLSGRVDGWRSSKPLEWFKQIFYWPAAHEKILFGSDVHADEMQATIEDHRRIFGGIGWTEPMIANVMANNAKRLFTP